MNIEEKNLKIQKILQQFIELINEKEINKEKTLLFISEYQKQKDILSENENFSDLFINYFKEHNLFSKLSDNNDIAIGFIKDFFSEENNLNEEFINNFVNNLKNSYIFKNGTGSLNLNKLWESSSSIKLPPHIEEAIHDSGRFFVSKKGERLEVLNSEKKGFIEKEVEGILKLFIEQEEFSINEINEMYNEAFNKSEQNYNSDSHTSFYFVKKLCEKINNLSIGHTPFIIRKTKLSYDTPGKSLFDHFYFSERKQKVNLLFATSSLNSDMEGHSLLRHIITASVLVNNTFEKVNNNEAIRINDFKRNLQKSVIEIVENSESGLFDNIDKRHIERYKINSYFFKDGIKEIIRKLNTPENFSKTISILNDFGISDISKYKKRNKEFYHLDDSFFDSLNCIVNKYMNLYFFGQAVAPRKDINYNNEKLNTSEMRVGIYFNSLVYNYSNGINNVKISLKGVEDFFENFNIRANTSTSKEEVDLYKLNADIQSVSRTVFNNMLNSDCDIFDKENKDTIDNLIKVENLILDKIDHKFKECNNVEEAFKSVLNDYKLESSISFEEFALEQIDKYEFLSDKLNNKEPIYKLKLLLTEHKTESRNMIKNKIK